MTFLETNLLTITVFLALLSTQLIYSLMLSDVEERTYEFGMLRALGFNTKNVMMTIFIQAMIFAIPGVITGLGMASILNAGVRYEIFTLTQNVLNYGLTSSAVKVGVSVGIIIPIVANTIPIRHALGKNLRSSLDPARRTAGEITVQFSKLNDIGMSISQLVMAVMLVILSIGCYYFAPVSFINGDTRTFSLIM